MRALLSVTGYVLPDPDTPNRLTVWFTGGKLSPASLSSHDSAETDDEDEEDGDSFESSEDAIDEAISGVESSDEKGPSTTNPSGGHGTDASEITRDHRGPDRTSSRDAESPWMAPRRVALLPPVPLPEPLPSPTATTS